jgi:hypothetical protein
VRIGRGARGQHTDAISESADVVAQGGGLPAVDLLNADGETIELGGAQRHLGLGSGQRARIVIGRRRRRALGPGGRVPGGEQQVVLGAPVRENSLPSRESRYAAWVCVRAAPRCMI